jgi:hypothetical protein
MPRRSSAHPACACYAVLLGSRNGRGFSARDDRKLQSITRNYFPEGFTIIETKGGWWNPEANTFVRETSRQIQVCSEKRKAVQTWARMLGRELNQKEILLLKVGSARRIRIR